MATATADTEAVSEGGGELHPDESEVLGQNGKSIEDRANDGEHEDPDAQDDDGTGQFTIPGTSSGLTVSAGGKRPTVSAAKLDGMTLRLVGEFKKGDRVRLVVDAVVRDVQFPDTLDKAGEVTLTTRKHIFRPIAVEPVPITD
jgi:hypothetical protein